MGELKKGDIIEIKNKLFIYEILDIKTEKNNYDYYVTILELQVANTSLDMRYRVPTEKIDEYIKILYRGGKKYE